MFSAGRVVSAEKFEASPVCRRQWNVRAPKTSQRNGAVLNSEAHGVAGQGFFGKRRCARFVHRENYHSVMGTEVDLLKHPVVSAAVGGAAMAVGAAEAAYRVAEKVPVFGPLMRRGVVGLSERGDRWVTQSADQFKALVGAVAVGLVDLVLDEMDLNALVRERVDIDALAADLDIDAVINRVDLITLADKVIEGVDLPAIIRESTNSMTAEVMTDVRTQGERADDVVAGIVNRMLGRDRDNR